MTVSGFPGEGHTRVRVTGSRTRLRDPVMRPRGPSSPNGSGADAGADVVKPALPEAIMWLMPVIEDVLAAHRPETGVDRCARCTPDTQSECPELRLAAAGLDLVIQSRHGRSGAEQLPVAAVPAGKIAVNAPARTSEGA